MTYTWITGDTKPKDANPVWVTITPYRKNSKPRLALARYWNTSKHHQSDPEWQLILVLDGSTYSTDDYMPDEDVMAWSPIEVPTVYTP